MFDSMLSQRVRILDTLLGGYKGQSFGVRFWDGLSWISPGGDKPVCTIVVSSASALRSLLINPSEITLGEGFLSKEIDVEGDIFSVFDVTEHLFRDRLGQGQRMREIAAGVFSSAGSWLKRGTTHSIKRDRAAISYHYDQPVGFYRPWLGESLAYSCAYFQSPSDSIDTAQTNKFELICRKLRLEAGERFLDIGCGWGGLILHAASQHGADAQGITISRQQAAAASARIEKERLAKSCHVDLLDYRAAPEKLGQFDKIASVGMFEHVGLRYLPLYFKTVHKLLKPGGVFLNHGIARSQFQGIRGTSGPYKRAVQFLREVLKLHRPQSSSFIDKYVFPDGELVTISQAMRAAEGAGFELRDVENLREHYEITLRRWAEGLQRNADALLRLVPETTFRIWLLYTAGSAAAFKRGDIALYQALLSSPDRGKSRLPLRRDDWYLPSMAGAEDYALRH